VRHLRLHPDEMLDRRERRPFVPLEQQLPRERRAVQRALAEHLVHGAIVAHAPIRPGRVNLVDKWVNVV